MQCTGAGYALYWGRICSVLGRYMQYTGADMQYTGADMQCTGAGYALYWGRICIILGQDMQYTGAGYAVYWGRICSILGQDMHYIGAGYALYWGRICGTLLLHFSFSYSCYKPRQPILLNFTPTNMQHVMTFCENRENYCSDMKQFAVVWGDTAVLTSAVR